MRRLITFGDSFVEGYVKKGDNEEKSFTDFLGESLGIESINQGKRGNSDFVISYDVLRYINNRPTMNLSKDCAFLISWSGWRRGYKTKIEDGQIELYGGVEKRLHSEAALGCAQVHKHQVELSQYAMVGFLTAMKIPFLFTNSFQDLKKVQTDYPWRLPWEHYIEGEADNNTIQDILKGTWLKSQGKRKLISRNHRSNAVQIEKKYGDLTHACGHPTRAGHELISKTLEPYIKELIK